jgi:hypothetical protein
MNGGLARPGADGDHDQVRIILVALRKAYGIPISYPNGRDWKRIGRRSHYEQSAIRHVLQLSPQRQRLPAAFQACSITCIAIAS